MDSWGEKMLATVSTVAEAAAMGLGLERNAFSSRMRMGPHLLAPTGALFFLGGCVRNTLLVFSMWLRVCSRQAHHL